MNERLLQYIWQFQHFNLRELRLSDSASLEIIQPGIYNVHQGPDFIEGRIRIDNTLLVGNIELHIKASDWNRHLHQHDHNYNNVILHIVWHNDDPLNLKQLPTLVLQDRVSQLLLNRYEDWMQFHHFIPCENQIASVNDLVWSKWKERLLISRLERKSAIVQNYLLQNKQHWEETFWWLISRNFGANINSDAFEAIARTIPLSLIAKHKNQLIQLESLLIGQGGLLESSFEEGYPVMLQKEYLFFRKKYQLQPIRQPIHFLRMRPVNFPTIRLAQLAMLVHQSTHLFTYIKEAESLKEVINTLGVTANDYWHYHYVFDELSVYNEKKLGHTMINNLIINTVIPVLFTYGAIHKEAALQEKSMRWLEEALTEKNNITNAFRSLGVILKNGFDSQAILELKTQYCDHRKCLECAVGNYILKRGD